MMNKEITFNTLRLKCLNRREKLRLIFLGLHTNEENCIIGRSGSPANDLDMARIMDDDPRNITFILNDMSAKGIIFKENGAYVISNDYMVSPENKMNRILYAGK